MRVRIESTTTTVLDVEVPDTLIADVNLSNDTSNLIVTQVTEWADQHGIQAERTSGNVYLMVYGKGSDKFDRLRKAK